ncbi:hypothetical protein ACP26F_12460 [Franconibacter pulveris 1160]|uniref:UPF0509 protein ACH50_04785 n=2 Tax=Franconibacter TaxID=1649295 RepID=A0A0J8VRT1_9ENTR|nr:MULTISPECIES: hypothetical protein [Franconibacter]KMV35647.1 hypothetical protein ACH50_04785 [Franconibacter pulveris]MCK1968360.1 hypothetical protein [Franconibacter sp. IITDAS19]MEB5922485.1 hypothetical protein [Franconibacter daqui]GGD18920.1 UPF0509 protein [Franconibacter daqui]
MNSLDPRLLAQRIDTVLDILVAGDYSSAINNLEILKAELLAQSENADSNDEGREKSPWEI